MGLRKYVTQFKVNIFWGYPFSPSHAGFAPWPNILCENLGFQASILQGQLRVFVFTVSFSFAVEYLLLSWGICFCHEVFAFAVRVLVLPWQFWAIVGVSSLSKSNHLNLPKTSSIFPRYSLVGEFSRHPWISVHRAKSAVYSKDLLFTSS